MPVKLIVTIVSCLVAAFLLIGAGLWIGYSFGKPSSPGEDTVVVDGGIVDQILQISELATVNYHTAAFEKRQHRSQAMKINVWADADFDVYLFWQGRVKAGVNLDEAMVNIEAYPASADTAKKGIVVITLPAAAILSVEPDENDGFMFFINWVSTTGKRPPDEETAKWANEGVVKLRAAATKNNILAEATKNAKTTLAGYINLLGYDVRFTEK